MSQPPHGGTTATPKNDFGATTISGRPNSAAQNGQSAQNGQVAGAAPAARQGPPPNGPGQTATATAPAPPATAPVGTPSGPPMPATPPKDVGQGQRPTERTGEQGRTTGTIPGIRNSSRNRGPRRARLQIRHINPLTVLKFSCVLAVALFFVWLIAVGVLYGVLDAAGIIGNINDTVTTINGPGSAAPVTAGIVFGAAAIIGVINIVLFIALTTVGSVIYNLCADLVGGVEITLSER